MDAYGRKNALLLSVAPLIAGWSSIALAESHTMILAGRVICGIAVGLMSAPAQVSSTCIHNYLERTEAKRFLRSNSDINFYSQILLAEISQANLRGKFFDANGQRMMRQHQKVN